VRRGAGACKRASRIKFVSCFSFETKGKMLLLSQVLALVGANQACCLEASRSLSATSSMTAAGGAQDRA
jgi:hypothetical protein